VEFLFSLFEFLFEKVDLVSKELVVDFLTGDQGFGLLLASLSDRRDLTAVVRALRDCIDFHLRVFLLLNLYDHVLEFGLVLLELGLELFDHLVGTVQLFRGVTLGYLVDVDHSFNVLGFSTKVKSVHCLLVVRQSLGHGTDDCGLGVTSQSWLENTGYFGVSIADEVLAIFATTSTKLIDDIR
jgi:hypothetical protein